MLQADRSMKIALILFVHLIVSVAKLVGPGGSRGLLAESLAFKHQLMIVSRSRQRAPNLTSWDRVFLGLWSLLIKPSRVGKIAVLVSTATLFKFHTALKNRKYRRLFSTTRPKKPGPKGPSHALIKAIVEMKSRNPRYG